MTPLNALHPGEGPTMHMRSHRCLGRAGRRTTITALTGVIALCAALAGCGGSGQSDSSATSRPSATTSDTPTSTTATTKSPVTAGSTTTVQGPSGPAADYPAAQPTPPSLVGAYPTGSAVDLVAVIKTLNTYEDWVYSHPNPGLIRNYLWTTANTYAHEVENLTTLQQKAWHTDPTPTIIQWAKVTLPPVLTPYQIDGHRLFRGGTITIVQDATGGTYLDNTGRVVGHLPAEGLVAYSISLAQDVTGAQSPDGQFRIVAVRQLQPPGGISALEAP